MQFFGSQSDLAPKNYFWQIFTTENSMDLIMAMYVYNYWQTCLIADVLGTK